MPASRPSGVTMSQAQSVIATFQTLNATPVPTLSQWMLILMASLLALLALIAQLQVVNDAAVSVYYRWAVENWMQRSFIRLYGLTQWLGWLWPYAALAYVMVRLVRRPAAIPASPPAHGA